MISNISLKYCKNKLAVCEEKCYLKEYNKTIEKAKCSCKTKTAFVNKISENILNEEGLYEIFTDFNNIMNIKVLKCINSILTFKAFKENYANVILIAIIILYFICLILFILKGYDNEIKFYIDIIIYFSLFHEKLFYIIQKKNRKETKINSFFIRNETKNSFNLKKSKKKLVIKNNVSNPNKKNIFLNIIKGRNLKKKHLIK